VSAPWLTTKVSATKKPAAKSMSRMPAQLTGRTWRPNRAITSEIAPTVPGRISPGFQSSIVIPSTPTDNRITIRFGSMSVSRMRFQSDIST
jgi:hypothetical protein